MRHPAIDIQIAACFLAAVGTALPSGDMSVIVILMNGASHLSDVNHRSAVKERIFNQPLIEPRAAKGQAGHLRIYVSRKYKSIDGGVMAGDTWGQKPKVQRPIRVEIQIFSEINLPAMSDGQKLRNLLLNSGDGVLKFLQQNKCPSLRSRAWASWSLPLLVA
jgi:hypothetical protein